LYKSTKPYSYITVLDFFCLGAFKGELVAFKGDFFRLGAFKGDLGAFKGDFFRLGAFI